MNLDQRGAAKIKGKTITAFKISPDHQVKKSIQRFSFNIKVCGKFGSRRMANKAPKKQPKVTAIICGYSSDTLLLLAGSLARAKLKKNNPLKTATKLESVKPSVIRKVLSVTKSAPI